MKRFKYVSLFSGIGGFETALNRLGGECVMASEIDPHADRAYSVLYGHKTAGDVTKIEANDVPDHDVLVGGFPCQAFSVAGKRLGFEDTRGTLFFEIARIVRVKRPKLLLLENVKGLLSHDSGRTLDVIVSTLSEIGYAVDFTVLNSKHFDVPQNRERIFIVAVRDAVPQPWLIHGNDVAARAKKRLQQLSDVQTFNFTFPTNETVTTRLLDVLEPDVSPKYYMSDDKTSKLLSQLSERQLDSGDDLRMVGLLDMKGNESIRRVYDPTGCSPTLTTMEGGHREPKIFHKRLIRKLTPLECFRLQGLPDEHYRKLREAKFSDSRLYKFAGNAVTVNVIEAIGTRLLKLL